MPAIHNGSTIMGFTASGALKRGLRVKIVTGKVAAADAADTNAIGTLLHDTLADGDFVDVQLFGLPRPAIAGEELATVGAAVKWADSGKVVAATADAESHGVVLTTAGGDGDVVEMLHNYKYDAA